jgi:hypothetical protein
MKAIAMATKARVSSAHAIAALALAVALGGTAYAATGGIPGPGGVISGCFNKKTGQLRVVGAGTHCNRKHERRLSWNQTGPKGTPGPITGALPSGVTLRGEWAIRLQSGAAASQRLQTGISFGFSLPAAPTPNFIPIGGTVPAGCAGGTATAPTAQPGNLCVYEVAADNISPASQTIFRADGTDGVDDPFGAGLAANTVAANTDTRWRGTWAVTAP